MPLRPMSKTWPQHRNSDSQESIFALDGRDGGTVAAWVWILLIVLIVLLLFGGVGYSRR